MIANRSAVNIGSVLTLPDWLAKRDGFELEGAPLYQLDVAAIQCKDRTKFSSDKIDLVFASRSATGRNFFGACESVNQTE